MPAHLANQIPLVVWDLKWKTEIVISNTKNMSLINVRSAIYLPSFKSIHLPKIGAEQMV